MAFITPSANLPLSPLTGDEKAEKESQRAEQECQRVEEERQRADRLAEILKAQGINPDHV
ncbi:MAG: hypothetical protein VKL39_22245 [Leptolyngbyaceae bacterium]|nr:hypothetical protein [Leptolyngbyaceae bacterium]